MSRLEISLIVCITLLGPACETDTAPTTDGGRTPDVSEDTPFEDVPEDIFEFDPSGAHFIVPLDAPDFETGRLIGWNIGRGTLYAPEGDPLHPEWRTPQRALALQEMRALRGPHQTRPWLRFSGLQIDGFFGADGYHFYDFVDPDRGVSEDDNMASFQYWAMMDEVDADPVIMLNFGSGTAAEAAAYVRHLNGDGDGPDVDARRHWGRTEPYGQQLFAVGNEVYGEWNTAYQTGGEYSYSNPNAVNGGDPPWHRRPASDPANYAERAIEYIDAVLEVTPDARFWIPFAQGSMDAWGGIENAADALEPLLIRPEVEAVVIHQYHIDDVVLLGYRARNDPQFILAASEVYRPEYERLESVLAGIQRDVPLDVAVTEYHVAGALARFEFDLGDQAIMGLGIAEMLIFYAQIGIDAACQHMALNFEDPNDPDRDPLLEFWYNPFRALEDGSIFAAPSHVVHRMLADSIGEQTVLLEPVSVGAHTYTVGQRSFDYPLVHGVAFANVDETGTVWLLNRDMDAATDVTLDLPDGYRAESMLAYAPDRTDLTAAEAPSGGSAISFEQDDVGRVRFELPAHALVVVSTARSR